MTNDKILITGGNGLIGQSLQAKLKELGCTDVRTFRKSEFDLERQSDVESLFINNQDVTIIFHLAAKVGGIIANKENKADFSTANLLMNTFLLKYSNLYCKNIKKICLVGSGCVYPEHEVVLKEDRLWSGLPEENTRAYGIAKRMLHMQSYAYREQYNLPSILFLPTNIYGPNDNFSLQYSHVIPAIIRKVYDAKYFNKPLELFGTGSATRDFIYVDDVVNAMIYLAGNYNHVDPINIASGKQYSIREITNKICKLFDYSGEIIFNPNYPDGQMSRQFDISKIKSIINNFPTTDVDTGLQKTVEWFINQKGQFRDF